MPSDDHNIQYIQGNPYISMPLKIKHTIKIHD